MAKRTARKRKEAENKTEIIGKKEEARYEIGLWKAFENRNNPVKKYFVENYTFSRNPKTLELVLTFAGGEKTTLSVADDESFLIDELN